MDFARLSFARRSRREEEEQTYKQSKRQKTADGRQAKHRLIPHVEGNYAMCIYIPVAKSLQLEDARMKCFGLLQNGIRLSDPNRTTTAASCPAAIASSSSSPQMSSFGDVHFVETQKANANSLGLHISLSRVCVLRHHLIERFLTKIRASLQNIRRFWLSLDSTRTEIFSNELGNRYFAAIPVTRHCSEEFMKPLLLRVNEVLRQFGLNEFYAEPLHHLSLAWTTNERLRKVLDESEAQFVGFEKDLTVSSGEAEVGRKRPTKGDDEASLVVGRPQRWSHVREYIELRFRRQKRIVHCGSCESRLQRCDKEKSPKNGQSGGQSCEPQSSLLVLFSNCEPCDSDRLGTTRRPIAPCDSALCEQTVCSSSERRGWDVGQGRGVKASDQYGQRDDADEESEWREAKDRQKEGSEKADKCGSQQSKEVCLGFCAEQRPYRICSSDYICESVSKEVPPADAGLSFVVKTICVKIGRRVSQIGLQRNNVEDDDNQSAHSLTTDSDETGSDCQHEATSGTV